MQRARLATIRAMPLAFVVGGMALAVGFAMAAILGIANALPSEILAAFKPVEEHRPRGLMIIVDGVPTGVARGIQLGLLALLIGGVPAALLGTALLRWPNRERPWSEGWENAFRAAFVFQLSSLVFTTFLLALLLWAAYDSAAHAQDVVWPAGLLFVGVVFGIWGLRSWRVLQLHLEQRPSTIAVSGPANSCSRRAALTSGSDSENGERRSRLSGSTLDGP